MQIPISITETLASILDGREYKTAYNGESVGLDLYNAGPDVVVPPTSQYRGNGVITKTLVPTGVKIALPRNYVALVQERGSVTKTNFKVRAGVIDPGYTGEIFVAVANLGSVSEIITSGAKLPFQLLVFPCETDYQVISTEDFETITSDATRLEGQIGSSDN